MLTDLIITALLMRARRWCLVTC